MAANLVPIDRARILAGEQLKLGNGPHIWEYAIETHVSGFRPICVKFAFSVTILIHIREDG